MTDRIRRALKMPRRDKHPNDYVQTMRDVRCSTVVKSRETVQSINRLSRVVQDGVVDYDELNRAMFGRPGWPREGDKP